MVLKNQLSFISKQDRYGLMAGIIVSTSELFASSLKLGLKDGFQFLNLKPGFQSRDWDLSTEAWI